MSKNSLVGKLLKASNSIYKSSTRGSSNYITVNESINKIIYKIDRRSIRKEKIKNIFYVK